MKCPHCEKELDLLELADLNCEVYGGYPTSVTACCGNIVQCQRKIIISFHIPYNHEELKEDLWGNKKQATKKQ